MTNKEQDIKTIVEICEEIQKSNASRYDKERAIIHAYDHIRRIILIDKGGDDNDG